MNIYHPSINDSISKIFLFLEKNKIFFDIYRKTLFLERRMVFMIIHNNFENDNTEQIDWDNILGVERGKIVDYNKSSNQEIGLLISF